MPSLATYLTYREHSKDVQTFRNDKLREDAVRKAAFANHKLTSEELSLAKKRGEMLKRTIDALDEYSQTKTEDVESVTQTFLGETTGLLAGAGVGIGKIYQSTESGKRLTSFIASKMGSLKDSAPHVIPGTTGLLFGIVSSLPLLFSLTKVEIETPRIARFETLKGELSNTKDFAILTDEQIAQANENAKRIDVPKPKPTEKGLISSLNIFAQVKSYMDIVTKRAIYNKDKTEFENTQAKKASLTTADTFNEKDLGKAEETREITQRLVHKIDLESQDYIERVFKILDVASMCLFGFGVVGYWAIEKAMDLCKVKNAKTKNFVSVGSALAGVILLNSKVAEYRNNAIRIARHKKMNEVLADPTNFLKTPKHNINPNTVKVEKPKKTGLVAFLKEFKNDLTEYEKYNKTKRQEDKKFKLAVRNMKLSPQQMEDARLNQVNLFKSINAADNNKEKYEEAYEIFVTLLSTPMGLVATTCGNAFGYALHKIKNAPKSHMPLYSIIGTVAGLIPAIGIELYTTIQVRQASRVAYMKAQDDLKDKKQFLDYSKVKLEENPFLRLSFKNESPAFAKFK